MCGKFCGAGTYSAVFVMKMLAFLDVKTLFGEYFLIFEEFHSQEFMLINRQ